MMALFFCILYNSAYKRNRMKKFLATDFSLIFNFDDPNSRYQKFLSRGREPFKRLIENLILYDSIVIPTQDFLSITVLVGVLGEDEVIELLKAKSIQFLRSKGALAYIGNGGGVQSYLIGGPNQPLEAFCAPMDEAIDWALNGLNPKPKSRALPNLIAESTTEFEISKVAKDVKHETYMDILKSPELRSYFAIRNTDMDRLEGINPNQVRVFGGRDGNWSGDEIDTVMAITSANIELRMMEMTSADDTITENPIRVLLNAKATRTLERSSNESFTEFKEIAGLPDIGEVVLQKQISLSKIVELSKSKDANKFREWFHVNCRKDTITTAKEYSNLLKHVPLVQKFPARTLRFILTNLAGFTHPAAGVGASVVDSFFIDGLLRGNSPKFFIEKLEKTVKRG
jgi:hypothetical protein